MKKKLRGKGEGTIYRSKDGRWTGALTIGYNEKGNPIRKVIKGKTRDEVKQKLTPLLIDQQQGIPIITHKQTVAEFLKDWLENAAKPKLRPTTWSSYDMMCRLHIIPDLGDYQLTKLLPQHIQRLLQVKLSGGLSARMVRYIRTLLVSSLDQALKWGLVARNVAKLVNGPRSERKEIVPLTPKQATKFLQACQNDRHETLFQIALSLGLRRGEILALKWNDIDLKAKTLRVSGSLQRCDKKLQVFEPKTKKSNRTVRLPDQLIASLQSHRVRQLEDKLAAGKKWKDTGFLFTTPIGTPIDPRNLIRVYKELLTAAGLKDQRFHDLRHSCATFLLAQGVEPKWIQEILGHASISITLDIYTHLLPTTQEKIASAMDNILCG